MGEMQRSSYTAPERTTAPIPDAQWLVYREVIARARERGILFALGGGFAVSVYTGQWRCSKDLDVYVLPKDRDAMIEITRDIGLADYHDRVSYDRTWIYRSSQGEIIVDIMWAMANHRAPVDEGWLLRGAAVHVNDEHVHVLPVEEMIWDKLYVLQRDRCDWPDTLNLLYAAGPSLDWQYLFRRLDSDAPLLRALLSVFSWLSPGRACTLPQWIWDAIGLPAPAAGPDTHRERVDLLDRRTWFPAAGEPALC